MSELPIEVDNVSLAYEIDRKQASTFKEALINRMRGKTEREKLWAVSGVSLEVEEGETLGIVGSNGAGKSSFLKLLAGVLPPTMGRVIVRGTVAPIIALGTGFNNELSARENIILYGALLGREPAEMRKRVDGILEWAEISDYADQPTRTFSSGMVARLAFSVAVDVEPEVLLLDEVFAVGDFSFQQKSKTRMDNLINSGTTVVMVTHNLGLVQKSCDRVMWMDHGAPKTVGEPKAVVDAYKESSEEAAESS